MITCNSSDWELIIIGNRQVVLGRRERMAFKIDLGTRTDGLVEEMKETERHKVTPNLMA